LWSGSKSKSTIVSSKIIIHQEEEGGKGDDYTDHNQIENTGHNQIESNDNNLGSASEMKSIGMKQDEQSLKEQEEESLSEEHEQEKPTNIDDTETGINKENSRSRMISPPTSISPASGSIASKRHIQPGNHTNIPKPESRIGPNSESGYVHDPKFLQRVRDKGGHETNDPNNPSLIFNIPNDEIDKVCMPPGQGDELPQGAKSLQNIRSHIESLSSSLLDSTDTELRVSNYANTTTSTNTNISTSLSTQKSSIKIKLFCAIYTHAQNTDKTNIISQTWGQKCDGMLYASDVSNSTTGHVHLPSNSAHGFGYKSITQRVRAMFAYIYDNFLDDDEYDYFHFCGDDVFMIVENMREFLSSPKVQNWESGDVDGNKNEENKERYFIAGFWMHWWNFFPVGEFYLGGGSGYTLSKKALRAYVEGPLQTCNPYEDESSEDIYFARCVRQGLTSEFIDTRDDFGAHRYHQFNVSMHSEWPGERNWGVEMNKILWYSLDHMEKQFGFPFVTKKKYISNSSVTFHRHTQNYNLRRMELLLYRDLEVECGAYYDNGNHNDNNRTEIHIS